DDRVEKTPSLVDDVGEPFVVSIGEISLERRGLNGIDRQDGQQYRMTGQRVLIRTNNAAAGVRDCFCSFGGGSRRLLEPAFSGAETLCPGLGLARATTGWRAFDHSRDSTPLPPTSSISQYRDHDSSLAPTHIAFEMKDLLPSTENQFAVRDRHGQ